MQQNDSLTFSVRHAATQLQISRNLLYELVKQKKIPALRLGKVIRILRAALLAMLTNTGTPIEQNYSPLRHFPQFNLKHHGTVVDEEAGHVRR